MPVINDLNTKGLCLILPEDFSAPDTFECGQCFRWNADENGIYTGIASGYAAQVISQEGHFRLYCPNTASEGFWRGYFDMYRDYDAVRKAVSTDEYTTEAARHGRGIRMLRQEFFETLISFIISQCNNITRIKGIVEKLCELAGEPFVFEGNKYFTFPTPEAIVELGEHGLAPLRAGYRLPYILRAAEAELADGLSVRLEGTVYPEARKILMELPGIGSKVADCICLFGLGMMEAFPVDVWIKRALTRHFGKNFDPGIFGGYAGYANQVIFHYIRNISDT